MSDYGSVSPSEIETGVAGRACEACHKKKTKCDMQQPVCGLCRRTNKECHFPSTRKRPSRQEPSVRAKLQKVNGNLDRLVELLEANPGLEPESLQDIISKKSASNDPTTSSKSSPPTRTSRVDSKSTTSPGNDFSPPMPTDLSKSTAFPVSYELATQLVDIYFDMIQPWLPMLHKPTFMDWSSRVLSAGDDALSGLSANDAVFFNSMFALSARFCNHSSLIILSPKERGEKFMRAAEHWFRIVRDVEDLDLTFLKACVLLAYFHYATGHSKRGWYITHMCIRGCYELGLHQLDEGDDSEEPEDNDTWVEKESLRRVFWAIFEIDEFGSIVKRKPFAIDWRHVEVKMPVSDEAWFAGKKVESSKFLPGPACWKTLQGSPNQDERAWALLSKGIVGHVFDLMLFKGGITAEQMTTVENNISCFKLAMPESMQLTSPTWSATPLPPSSKNWVIASNLYLGAASFILTRIPIIGQPPSPKEEKYSKEVAAYSARVLELNEILKRWPADAIPYAYPCLACTILTYDESLVNLLPPSAPVNAYRDLSGLILAKIAERWTLGAVLLRVRDIAKNYNTSDLETKAELVKQYPVYFDREIRKNKKSVIEEAHKTWTPKVDSPSNLSLQNRLSIDQPLSPDQIPQPKLAPQHQQQQQMQQQPTPPFNYPSTTAFDPIFDPTADSSSNNMNNFQNFNPFPGPSQSPEDIDSLFAGFLQEPWWQDFGGVNFVV